MKPHVLSWIRFALADAAKRANTIVMLNTGSVGQYDAASALQRALAEAHGAPALPEPLRAALRAVSFEGRMNFFEFGDEAYRSAVNPLPDAFRRDVIAILRGDRDP